MRPLPLLFSTEQSETGIFYQNTSSTLLLPRLSNMSFFCLKSSTGYVTVLYSVQSCAATQELDNNCLYLACIWTCTATPSRYIRAPAFSEPTVIASVSSIINAPESSSYWNCGHYYREEEEETHKTAFKTRIKFQWHQSVRSSYNCATSPTTTDIIRTVYYVNS